MKKTQDQKNNGLVYSSEFGRMCGVCGKPADACVCRERQSAAAGGGIVRVRRETKGRKGKGVTVITGLALKSEQLKQLGKMLKTQCGSGGTVKDGVIEIQGDHGEKLIEILKKEGWTVKGSGG